LSIEHITRRNYAIQFLFKFHVKLKQFTNLDFKG